MVTGEDRRWLAAAARLARRGIPLTRPNPAVAALIVNNGRLIARGWTQPGGRPHAEAQALAAAKDGAAGATIYVSLEPCAHQSERGPACADLLAASGIARVVIGCGDPDPRTAGQGIARLRAAGITVDLGNSDECAESLSGYLTRTTTGRPHVTLKLALSADQRLAPPPGEGQWLTGPEARAHVHAWRARMDSILVGRGTLEADHPRLDVRLPGLAARSPERWLLTGGAAPAGWYSIASPQEVCRIAPAQYLMVEGGAKTARAFLAAGLVDRLLIYRAPHAVGGNGADMPELSEANLAQSAKWRVRDWRALGNDTVTVYDPA